VDPRNGQPRSDQANVKAVCNSYKKQQPQQQADTNKPAAQPAAAQECFAIETDLKVRVGWVVVVVLEEQMTQCCARRPVPPVGTAGHDTCGSFAGSA
jgi:hypothetical protein